MDSLLNFLLYYLIRRQAKTHHVAWGFITASALVFLIPVILSALMFKNAGESIDKSRPVNVVAVQQNTDPWEEEYSLNNEEHVQRLIEVGAPILTATPIWWCALNRAYPIPYHCLTCRRAPSNP